MGLTTGSHRFLHAGVQILRRGMQITVPLLMILLTSMSLYAHYRSARALEDLAQLDSLQGHLTAQIDTVVSDMNAPDRFLDRNKGTIWSMRLMGLDLTDPLAVLEATFASRTLFLPLVVTCGGWVLLTLLFGRVFCSWICPGYLLFEVTGKIRGLLRLAEIPTPEVSFSRKNKYAFLIVGLAIVSLFGTPLFALVYPPAVLSRAAHAWVFGTALTGMLVTMSLLVAFELFVSPRWWCRTMCPGGALYALIGWSRLLRVRTTPGRCTRCGVCNPACERGLDPPSESCGIECDNCGRCVRVCPEQALTFTLSPPRLRSAFPGTRRDGPRTATVLLLAFAGLIPSEACAHHILGLPHYSYKENYPQAPTLEYPAQSGPYDLLLTSYPGNPVPGEPANLAIYCKNRLTGIPYEQSISLRVLRTFTFGRNLEILPATVCHPFDKLHKRSVTFPDEGEYVVEVSMNVEGKTQVIPFVMVAGDPTAAWSVVAAGCLGLGLFLVVVRAVKIKRERRRLQAGGPSPTT